MTHDYANKYANYWSKKNKTIKSGKSAKNYQSLSEIVVDKRPTMQSSKQYEIYKFRLEDLKRCVNPKRMHSSRL